MLSLSLPASPVPSDNPASLSVLVLSDRFLALAEAADRAGYTASASRLVDLAHTVFDERPRQQADLWSH